MTWFFNSIGTHVGKPERAIAAKGRPRAGWSHARYWRWMIRPTRSHYYAALVGRSDPASGLLNRLERSSDTDRPCTGNSRQHRSVDLLRDDRHDDGLRAEEPDALPGSRNHFQPIPGQSPSARFPGVAGHQAELLACSESESLAHARKGGLRRNTTCYCLIVELGTSEF